MWTDEAGCCRGRKKNEGKFWKWRRSAEGLAALSQKRDGAGEGRNLAVGLSHESPSWEVLFFCFPSFFHLTVARDDYVTGRKNFNGTRSWIEHSDAA